MPTATSIPYYSVRTPMTKDQDSLVDNRLSLKNDILIQSCPTPVGAPPRARCYIP